MKKAIIIDDEAAGRRLIREYLTDYPDFIPLAEANNGVDAVRVCNEYRPDLIFLDVKMPGLTGFEVLTHLEEIPDVIFSTAYDKYALEAFEVHAIDYLLKPYTRDRFARAMQRLGGRDRRNAVAPLAESLLTGSATYPDRVLVNKGRKLITIEVGRIIWVEAFGDYAKLHTEEETYLSNHGISAVEERLDPKIFLRIHRSHMINLTRVREIFRYGKYYDVVMTNGAQLRVSRGYLDALRDITF